MIACVVMIFGVLFTAMVRRMWACLQARVGEIGVNVSWCVLDSP